MEYSVELINKNRIYTSRNIRKDKSSTNPELSFHFTFMGIEKFIFKKRSLSLFPDCFLLLNSGTSYLKQIDSLEPVQTLSIYFDKGFLNDFSSSWLNDHRYILDNYSNTREGGFEFVETIYPFKDDMKYNIMHLNNLINGYSRDELLINEHLYHTLLNYYFTHQKNFGLPEKRLDLLQQIVRKELLRRLNMAREYLYSNYNQDICLQQLADYSCLSVTHLIRTFKQAFRITPHKFLMNIRLSRAQFLLKSTSYPVNEVVNIIGLDSVSTFIKLFRQHYNTTPLQFRRSVK